MTAPEPCPPQPKSLRREVVDLLWQQPLWAIPFTLFFWMINIGSGRMLPRMYAISLVFAYCVRIALLIVGRVVAPRLRLDDAAREPERVREWYASLPYAAGAMVGSYVAAYIVHRTLLPGFLGSPRAFAVSTAFALLFTVLFTGIAAAISYHRQAVERGRAVELARAELAQAELRALRAQIHPHFLFNTLNTIAALIQENPAAAEETTVRLAETFRYTLRASEREHAPLGEELAFVRAYLDIERTRFGDRLRVEEHVEPGLEDAPVPSLLLQPIVENAVRYAVAARSEGGTIVLSASRAPGALVLEVSDDGPGFTAEAAPRGHGFGLHSVRERLRAAGLRDALDIQSTPGRGTRVRITLPTPPAAPAATKGLLP